MSKHFIFDFETFGTNVNDCAVIDCAFFVFDTEKMISDQPYTTRSITDMKKAKLSVKKQVDKYGWKVYNDTIKFWQNQSKDVQKLILPKADDLTVEDFAGQLFDILNQVGKISYWWTRSGSFDPPIMWRLMEAAGQSAAFNAHLPHWKHRDTRTFIDAKLDFPKVNGFVPIQDEGFWKKVFQEHNSSWDILADTLRIQAILRAEKDLEQVKR